MSETAYVEGGFHIAKITDHKINAHDKLEFFCQWEGYGRDSDSWEPLDFIVQATARLKEYYATLTEEALSELKACRLRMKRVKRAARLAALASQPQQPPPPPQQPKKRKNEEGPSRPAKKPKTEGGDASKDKKKGSRPIDPDGPSTSSAWTPRAKSKKTESAPSTSARSRSSASTPSRQKTVKTEDRPSTSTPITFSTSRRTKTDKIPTSTGEEKTSEPVVRSSSVEPSKATPNTSRRTQSLLSRRRTYATPMTKLDETDVADVDGARQSRASRRFESAGQKESSVKKETEDETGLSTSASSATPTTRSASHSQLRAKRGQSGKRTDTSAVLSDETTEENGDKVVKKEEEDHYEEEPGTTPAGPSSSTATSKSAKRDSSKDRKKHIESPRRPKVEAARKDESITPAANAPTEKRRASSFRRAVIASESSKEENIPAEHDVMQSAPVVATVKNTPKVENVSGVTVPMEGKRVRKPTAKMEESREQQRAEQASKMRKIVAPVDPKDEIEQTEKKQEGPLEVKESEAKESIEDAPAVELEATESDEITTTADATTEEREETESQTSQIVAPVDSEDQNEHTEKKQEGPLEVKDGETEELIEDAPAIEMDATESNEITSTVDATEESEETESQINTIGAPVDSKDDIEQAEKKEEELEEVTEGDTEESIEDAPAIEMDATESNKITSTVDATEECEETESQMSKIVAPAYPKDENEQAEKKEEEGPLEVTEGEGEESIEDAPAVELEAPESNEITAAADATEESEETESQINTIGAPVDSKDEQAEKKEEEQEEVTEGDTEESIEDAPAVELDSTKSNEITTTADATEEIEETESQASKIVAPVDPKDEIEQAERKEEGELEVTEGDTEESNEDAPANEMDATENNEISTTADTTEESKESESQVSKIVAPLDPKDDNEQAEKKEEEGPLEVTEGEGEELIEDAPAVELDATESNEITTAADATEESEETESQVSKIVPPLDPKDEIDPATKKEEGPLEVTEGETEESIEDAPANEIGDTESNEIATSDDVTEETESQVPVACPNPSMANGDASAGWSPYLASRRLRKVHDVAGVLREHAYAVEGEQHIQPAEEEEGTGITTTAALSATEEKETPMSMDESAVSQSLVLPPKAKKTSGAVSRQQDTASGMPGSQTRSNNSTGLECNQAIVDQGEGSSDAQSSEQRSRSRLVLDDSVNPELTEVAMYKGKPMFVRGKVKKTSTFIAPTPVMPKTSEEEMQAIRREQKKLWLEDEKKKKEGATSSASWETKLKLDEFGFEIEDIQDEEEAEKEEEKEEKEAEEEAEEGEALSPHGEEEEEVIEMKKTVEVNGDNEQADPAVSPITISSESDEEEEQARKLMEIYNKRSLLSRRREWAEERAPWSRAASMTPPRDGREGKIDLPVLDEKVSPRVAVVEHEPWRRVEVDDEEVIVLRKGERRGQRPAIRRRWTEEEKRRHEHRKGQYPVPRWTFDPVIEPIMQKKKGGKRGKKAKKGAPKIDPYAWQWPQIIEPVESTEEKKKQREEKLENAKDIFNKLAEKRFQLVSDDKKKIEEPTQDPPIGIIPIIATPPPANRDDTTQSVEAAQPTLPAIIERKEPTITKRKVDTVKDRKRKEEAKKQMSRKEPIHMQREKREETEQISKSSTQKKASEEQEKNTLRKRSSSSKNRQKQAMEDEEEPAKKTKREERVRLSNVKIEREEEDHLVEDEKKIRREEQRTAKKEEKRRIKEETERKRWAALTPEEKKKEEMKAFTKKQKDKEKKKLKDERKRFQFEVDRKKEEEREVVQKMKKISTDGVTMGGFKISVKKPSNASPLPSVENARYSVVGADDGPYKVISPVVVSAEGTSTSKMFSLTPAQREASKDRVLELFDSRKTAPQGSSSTAGHSGVATSSHNRLFRKTPAILATKRPVVFGMDPVMLEQAKQLLEDKKIEDKRRVCTQSTSSDEKTAARRDIDKEEIEFLNSDRHFPMPFVAREEGTGRPLIEIKEESMDEDEYACHVERMAEKGVVRPQKKTKMEKK